MRVLYITSQQRFHILFRIFAYLLKFVDSHHYRQVLAVKDIKKPFQRVFFFLVGLIGNLNLRLTCESVEQKHRS